MWRIEMPEEDSNYTDEPPTVDDAEKMLDEELKKLESSSDKSASILETAKSSDAPNETSEEDILSDEDCVNMDVEGYEKLSDKNKEKFGI